MISGSNNFITKIQGEVAKDSRGNDTIKVNVFSGNLEGSFSVPAGASTGSNEAHELRDIDGGVQSAIDNVNNIIAPKLIGFDILNQKEIDRFLLKLDGTKNKDKLGANAILGVSIAAAKLGAKIMKMETFEYLRTLAEIKPSRRNPYLFINLLEGGKHAKNHLAFQEYHIVPETENIKEAIEASIKIQHKLKGILHTDLNQVHIVMGDEGGYAPEINDISKPLLLLRKAILECGLPFDVHLALDVAGSSFYQNGEYIIGGENISKEKLLLMYKDLIKEFNLFAIEDPFGEKDFESFHILKNDHPQLFVVGDDLTVTNNILLKEAIRMDCINAMIIKPNQIGTLSETLDTMQIARENNIELIVSHRGEETDDDFIADLAFAFSCFGLKAGSPQKPERMIKYNRLLEISTRD